MKKLKLHSFTKFDRPLKTGLYPRLPGVGENVNGSGVWEDVWETLTVFEVSFINSFLVKMGHPLPSTFRRVR